MSNLTTPIQITTPDGRLVASLTMGSAEGDYPTLTLHMGDIINVRNIQGGTVESPNLDISAGDAVNRGHLSFQWDNGSDTAIYDGNKASLLRAYGVNHTKRALHSDVPHYLHAGAYVPTSSGWQKL